MNMDKETKNNFIQLLKRDFPLLWRGDVSEYEYLFSINQGWYNIIYDASEEIEKILTTIQFIVPTEDFPKVEQIKEKFGSLRFYCYFGENIPEKIMKKIHSIITNAETNSSKACEVCSSPGELRKKKPNGEYVYWLKTLCNTCWIQQHEQQR